MKVIFLDESGDHSLDKIDSSYPIFVLAGCIFDAQHYADAVEPAFDALKVRHFNTRDIILRSYDIRKQRGAFSSLVDLDRRKLFAGELADLLSATDFKIIAAGINKLAHKQQYSAPENPYHLCLQFIMERMIMYLGASSEQAILRIESREPHNDKELSKVYEQFRDRGNSYFKPEEVRKKLIDLSFNQKSQNIVGHQIADLVAYPIGRWVLDHQRENRYFKLIEGKIHSRNSEYINVGLKVSP